MVAAVAEPQQRTADVHLVTEIRGAPARLWDEATGEIVISGAAGTAKTRGILEYVHQRCSQERLRVLFLRKTQESLKSSALVTFTEEVLYGFDGKQSTYDAVTYFSGNKLRPAEFTYLATGSKIVAAGIDQSSKVKSTRWDIVFVNEATELTLDDWEMLTGRTDRPSMFDQPPSVVIGDCNPDAPTHWIMQRANQSVLKLWPSRHEDNPAMWDRFTHQWTPSGLAYMARLDALTGVRYQRLRLGKWVAAEGQVFASFAREKHVIPRANLEQYGLAKPSRHVGSVDWGWTKPGVITIGAIGGDRQIGIVHEVYHTRRGRDWWIAQAQALQTRYDVDKWVCDPSEPEYIDAWQNAGLNAVGAVNDILPGITAIEDRLAEDDNGRVRWVVVDDFSAMIDPDLEEDKQPTSALQEVDAYVWPKNVIGRKEKPVDEYNHAMDTWRYLAMEADGNQAEFPDDVDYSRFFASAGVAMRHG